MTQTARAFLQKPWHAMSHREPFGPGVGPVEGAHTFPRNWSTLMEPFSLMRLPGSPRWNSGLLWGLSGPQPNRKRRCGTPRSRHYIYVTGAIATDIGELPTTCPTLWDNTSFRKVAEGAAIGMQSHVLAGPPEYQLKHKQAEYHNATHWLSNSHPRLNYIQQITPRWCPAFRHPSSLKGSTSSTGRATGRNSFGRTGKTGQEIRLDTAADDKQLRKPLRGISD
eukprot:8508707-Pyramimonas_sp.AAC.1